MQCKLVMKGNKWFTLDDKVVPAKFFKKATLLKQGKVKGRVVFIYEATKEAQEILEKAKPAKVKAKAEAVAAVDVEVEELLEEASDDDNIYKDNQYNKVPQVIIKNRKINFIDDPRIGKEKKKIVLARGNTTTKKTAPPKPVVMRCSVCGRDVKVPAWEANSRKGVEGGSLYRCNSCCGG